MVQKVNARGIGSFSSVYAVDMRSEWLDRAWKRNTIFTEVSDILRMKALYCASSRVSAFEVDGAGTILLDEVLFHPGFIEIGDHLRWGAQASENLGINKVIWLKLWAASPGGIPTVHMTGLARFATPGVVLLNKPDFKRSPTKQPAYQVAKERLCGARDARDQEIEVIEIPEPSNVGPGAHEHADFSYLNFCLVNGAIIVPKYGDDTADAHAREILSRAFPGRTMETIFVRQLANMGGGIHRATMNIVSSPKTRKAFR